MQEVLDEMTQETIRTINLLTILQTKLIKTYSASRTQASHSDSIMGERAVMSAIPEQKEC